MQSYHLLFICSRLYFRKHFRIKCNDPTFDQQRHERNDGRLQFGHCESVDSVVPGWILWRQSH